jgi:protein-S-isoprenylcysteine O-methyltransferase Ste14
LALLALVIIQFLIPGHQFLKFPWNLSGFIPLILGSLLNLIADKAFKNARTTVKPFETSSKLITTGVFKLSRNPMYLGMVLILTGIAVLIGSWPPFIICAVFAFLMDVKFIKIEEKMLAEIFPDQWENYTRKVRRWI